MQLVARDRQHGDARFVVLLVGPDVALVADHHARTDGQDVVSVVPLLAFGFKGIAAGGDQAHLVNAEGFLDGVQQVGFLSAQQAAASVRGERPALGVLAHHFRVNGESVHVDVGHHGVEVHAGAMFRQLNGDHAFGLTMFKQAVGEELHALRRRALRHADQYRPAANH